MTRNECGALGSLLWRVYATECRAEQGWALELEARNAVSPSYISGQAAMTKGRRVNVTSAKPEKSCRRYWGALQWLGLLPHE